MAQRIIAIETHYAPYHILETHQHQRAQLLYAAEGLMQVETPQGNWIIPPERAVWIPPHTPHRLHLFKVRTCSLYIAVEHINDFSAQCEVLNISPLLRQLLLKAPELIPPFNPHDNLIFDLILLELATAPRIALHLPMPTTAELVNICQNFLRSPNIHLSPEQVAKQIHLSERHFSRIFKQQVGMSFCTWRQHACILISLERLMQNKSIQQIAYEFGFITPAAFSRMFHRILGQPPSRYLAHSQAEQQLRLVRIDPP